MKFFYFWTKVFRGQSITRIMMNDALSAFAINGRVVDVGGARSPDYYQYLIHGKEVRVEVVDGLIEDIDFEVDRLPFSDNAVDTVVCCNVFEHIYNYRHLAREISRILKPEGRLIGFVPFLIQYHPDPNDYFRYTRESLSLIWQEVGLADIVVKPIGLGPFFANLNNIMLYCPVWFRCVVFPFYYGLARMTVWLRPVLVERFPLGFVFYTSGASN